MPANEYLKWIAGQVGVQRYWLLPNIFWFNCADLTLKLICYAGIAISVFLLIGFHSTILWLLLWMLYLSLCSVGQDFLAFQWDILLLEAGLLILFLSPALFSKPRDRLNAAGITRWLLWWLLFRLMFSSGIAKLRSGDPTWRNMTALSFHYETQPLPTALGWYAHLLPQWFHKVSVAGMFFIELIVPFLIFAPRRLRHLAVWPLIALQLVIALTGNYCFFNLLTIFLCVLLIDDEGWEKLGIRRRESEYSQPTRWILFPAAVLLFLSVLQLSITLGWQRFIPQSAFQALQYAEPFRSVNRYGLFAVMTTRRQEIIIEGSNDQVHWVPYEFRYKPDQLNKFPAYIEPFQPRLDWQMWFAALGTYRDNPWFVNFCGRLLQGSKSVCALLKRNPFPNAPPRYIRAEFYDYHFSSYAEHRATGSWWTRTHVGMYCPVISFR